MLAIRLEKELEQELDLFAKAKGSNRSAVVREAIVRYLVSIRKRHFSAISASICGLACATYGVRLRARS